jgi:hypothetical protein
MNRILLITSFVAGFIHTLFAAHLSDRLTFSARLKPLPNVMSNGNGVAAMMLNNTHDTLFISVSVAKLSSPIVAYHFENRNQKGKIILDFDGKVLGNTVRTYITGSQLQSILKILLEGDLVITVPSQKHPTGELNAAIQLETDWSFSTHLDGHEIGGNQTAMGLGNIVIGMNVDTLIVKAATSLSNDDITGIFLSKNGTQEHEVVLDLTTLIEHNTQSICGGWKLSSREWNEMAALLLSNQLNLIITTTKYPKGALSGLLSQQSILQFDSWVSKPNNTFVAHATAHLSSNFDSLYYSLFYTGIETKSIEAFWVDENNIQLKQLSLKDHFAEGVWTIYDDINPLTPAIVNQLLKGNISWSLATQNADEHKGPLVKLAREGFIAELTNTLNQTESGGQGTAVASYDRDRKNVHCMFAFDGLQGDLKSTHISFGKKGDAGSVEMITEPFTNNGSYKYLRTEEIFAKTKALKISKKENTFLIIETTAFEDGEISGQFKWNYKTTTLTEDTNQFSGLDENLISDGSFKVFPNPTTNSIKVYMVAKVDGFATLIISNTNGEELLKQTSAIEKGRNMLELDMTNLPIGFYFIELAINGIPTSNTKVVKQ